MNEMPFTVHADENTEAMAAFQYVEWARDWRDKYCATGVIRFCGAGITGDVPSVLTTTTILPFQTGYMPLLDNNRNTLSSHAN